VAEEKQRVRKAVADLAEELLELYASRANSQGHGFAPDTPWQAEMEASFPYEETPDQLRAAAEVKLDMEAGRPMDRLVVGDVGYGKTEVALRGAFKAIQDGKQVAVLVPTTVLAAQHHQTFSQRFAAFPIRVRLLSRFVSQADQKTTLEGLREGSVDLVIGPTGCCRRMSGSGISGSWWSTRSSGSEWRRRSASSSSAGRSTS